MRWLRRRGALDDFADGIRPELQHLHAPGPREDLLQRILVSRASGARVILPDAQSSSRPASRFAVTLAAVAAAMVLVAIPMGRRASTPGRQPATIDGFASEWFAGSAAFAQPPAAIDRPRLPPLVVTRPATLRPVVLDYAHTSRDSAGAVTVRMHSHLAVTADSVDGVPAWHVIAHDTGTRHGVAREEIDTVVVARDNLRLLRRTAIVRPYLRYDEIRIRQRFSGDSVVGRMNARGADASAGGRPIARRLEPAFAPYIADAFVPLLLGAVTLDRDWSASVSLIGWAVRDDDVFVPVELRVEGDEWIAVPAGRFDCWRISIRYSDSELQYWSRKTDGIGVRLLHRGRSGSVREAVLTGENRR